MKDMRRKEKAITSQQAIKKILTGAKYVTVAMCENNEPYLVTLSHGYDQIQNCLYFHCAGEGKKLDILRRNQIVWGQALADKGYAYGKCDHLYATVHFSGRFQFVTEFTEKKAALEVMIEALEENPGPVKEKQLTDEAIRNVTIGRIDIHNMSGKKSKGVVL
jgi:nitroimidazol reductase NimA-like FMN-containing flavoprotein (pyridoxamine 5'-phosphate oxidase superfamily)